MSEQKPTAGRIVLYAIKTKHGAVEERPAVIVRTWGDADYVNLQVLLDGSNDFDLDNPGKDSTVWKTSVYPSASGDMEEGRFRFPPRS